VEFSPTQRVRTTCKAVAERAVHVRINWHFIPAYALQLPVKNAVSPELDPNSHHLGHGDDTVAFILTLDSVNFGSGYFPHLHKRPGMSGYFTVASSLNDYFRKNGALSPDELSKLTSEDCAEIFGQDLADPPIAELMQHFTTGLKNLGQYVNSTFCGNFVKLVDAAESSTDRLVRLLVEMPYFKDVEPYAELQVPFYKRAQLTAADLSLAFNGKGPGRFHDLDNLTIFADNLVPHVLRLDGVLRYEETLAERIEAGELIPAGSAEEVEIRACAVHAVELIKANLYRSGHKVTSAGLDYLLWNRGRQPYYKAYPRHRTRTVFY
jgi:hypothetical protein